MKTSLSTAAAIWMVGCCNVCCGGILALEASPFDAELKLPFQVINTVSPGYKDDTNHGGKRFAEAYRYANNDNVRGKGPNIWAAYDLSYKAAEPVDILFVAWNDSTIPMYGKDEFEQWLIKNPETGELDGSGGLYDREPDIGTPTTTEYWMPLSIRNMSTVAWKGVKFSMGFGTYVKDVASGVVTDNFAPAGTVDLDFDFNFELKDDAAGTDLVLDPNGQNDTDTGLDRIAPKNMPDMFSWIDMSGMKPIKVNNIAGTFQWSIDVPNWENIPEEYRFEDQDLEGNPVDAYGFTIRISPIPVPEPFSATFCGFGAAALILLVRRRGEEA